MNDAKTPTEIKIILIGESYVGKTSIVQRLTTHTFNEKETPTLGAAYASLEGKLNDKNVSYQFWDTAGQEQYRDMAPMYFQGSNAILCIFSVTDRYSFEAVDDWAKMVYDNLSKDHLFLLIANKIDLTENRQIQADEGLSKAEQINAYYYEVSAKTGEGFDALLDRIGNLYFESQKLKENRKKSFVENNQTIDDDFAEMAPTEEQSLNNDKNCCHIS